MSHIWSVAKDGHTKGDGIMFEDQQDRLEAARILQALARQDAVFAEDGWVPVIQRVELAPNEQGETRQAD